MGKKIGQLLREMGYITQTQIDFAVKKQQQGDKRRLGEILLDLGYVTKAQLNVALVMQNKTKAGKIKVVS